VHHGTEKRAAAGFIHVRYRNLPPATSGRMGEP
jgi:hypothetical protein